MMKNLDLGTEIIEIRSEDALTDEFLNMIKQEAKEKDFVMGYYNRDTFVSIVNNYGSKQEDGGALLLFEINGFQMVNDALGRFQADGLLMRTSMMIGELYPNVCMGRLYMDMFGIFVPGCKSADYALELGNSLCEKIVVYRKTIKCTLTIGVTYKKSTECVFDDMYNEAFIALFEARRNRKAKCCLYNDSLYMQKDLEEFVDSYNSDLGIVMSDYDSAIYIADPISYELLYVNKQMKKTLNLTDDVVGQKCYKALAKLDRPCSYCTNSILSKKSNCFWSFEDENRKKKYVVKDSIKQWHGRKVRGSRYIDVTNQDDVLKIIEKSSDTEYTLKQCMNQMINSDNMQHSYNNVLKLIGEYYHAERARFYETDGEYAVTYVHNWSDIKRGLLGENTINNLEMLINDDLVKRCTNEENVTYIEDVAAFKEDNAPLYDELVSDGVKSLLFVRLLKNSQTKGYIVLFNPTDHLTELSILVIMSSYIVNEIIRTELWNQRTYELTHDKMTGSYNRTSYIEFINEIKEAQSLGYVIADVNGMKKINENAGYEYGDEMLTQIARILREVFVGYPVFRFGGDEFTICCVDITKEEFAALIEKAKSVLKLHETGAALGYVWDDYDIDIKKMDEHANQFLLMNKRKIYQERNTVFERENNKIVNDILEHIANKEFKVYLQPKFNMLNGKCCGAEALIRLEHPEFGLMMPGRFIPDAEKSGGIYYIDMFVFERVCQILDSMKKEKREMLPISFNFSRMTLMNEDLFKNVEDIMSRYDDVSKKYLEIEITESIGDIENDLISQIANGFHERGFRLSMDDFGTKYSSISILSLMRFDILKIDRSMVNNITDNEISRKVIKHVIAMCNDLGIECIAEGVEEQEQADLLTNMNCWLAQGYLYGKPMPEEEFRKRFITA